MKKNMKKKFVVLILLVQIILSCANNTNNVDTRMNVYSLAVPEHYKYLDSNIKVSYEVLVLDVCNEDALLPNISELHIHNNKLYIRAEGGVYIFDDKGNYIDKLEQGRGPGEFLGASDILINEDEELEVLSRTDIYKFTLNGDFIDKVQLPKRLFVEFAKMGNKYLLSTPRITNKTTHFFYLFEPHTKEEIPIMQGVERPLSQFNFNLFADIEGFYCFTTPYSGTYYKLEDDFSVQKVFRFEPSISEEKLLEPIVEYDKMDNLSEHCYGMFYHCRNLKNKYFSLKVSYGNKAWDIIYDIRNGATFYNIFEGFFSAVFIGNDDEWLYYSISPVFIEKMAEKEFKNDVAKNLVKDLYKIIESDPQREGNPIIIKVKYE